MKCEKCGANIPQGYVYCSVCGAEVQLVPDYNFLDEDLLGSIVQGELKEDEESKQEVETVISGAKTEKRKNIYIWGGICTVILAAVLTLFVMYEAIQYKHKNSYTYQYQQAEEFAAEGNIKEAIEYFHKALKLKPNDKAVKEQLYDLYLKEENYKAASALLEEFIFDGNVEKESLEAIIDLYAKEEEYEKILTLYEKIGSSEWRDLFADYLVERPTFSNISGTYFRPLKIEISSVKDYDIFYTTDGSDPVSKGTLYEDSISFTEEGTTILTAVTRNEKGIYSEIAQAEYTIKYEPPEMPDVMPAGGTYTEPQMITIQVPMDCSAYYTWDGSDPTESSLKYQAPLEMPQGNQVLSVILVNSVGLKSCVYRVNYVYMP